MCIEVKKDNFLYSRWIKNMTDNRYVWHLVMSWRHKINMDPNEEEEKYSVELTSEQRV